MRIPIKQAEDYIQQVLSKYGYSREEVEKIAEVMLYAVLRDSSQGFPKLFGWHIHKDLKAIDPVYTQITQSVGRYNANRNNSMYVCNLAIDKVFQLALKEGIGLVGVFNHNNSSGAIGYYTRKLAIKGLVSLMFASADPIGGIAPPNSKKGVFGSNPLAISIPYKGAEITLDMSTAKFTWGDLVKALNKKEKLEAGFAFDNNGKATVDPQEAMKGTVLAFDGTYKGLGLAFMIQILAGALVGSVYEQSDEICDYGDLIIAIDPDKLAGQNFLELQVEKIIKSYKKERGKNIFLPGEKGQLISHKNNIQETVEISDKLLQKIKEFLKSKEEIANI